MIPMLMTKKRLRLCSRNKRKLRKIRNLREIEAKIVNAKQSHDPTMM